MSAIAREPCGCERIFCHGEADKFRPCSAEHQALEHKRLDMQREREVMSASFLESLQLLPKPKPVIEAAACAAAAKVAGIESQPEKIKRHCDELKALLLEKNKGYSKGGGFTPTRVFSKASTVERICTRLDDKLSRWVSEGPTKENVDDMLGYLILIRVEREQEGWK